MAKRNVPDPFLNISRKFLKYNILILNDKKYIQVKGSLNSDIILKLFVDRIIIIIYLLSVRKWR